MFVFLNCTKYLLYIYCVKLNLIFFFLFYRFWDDWIRQPAQRRERACIRPEISRTKTFGKVGVSKYAFFPLNFNHSLIQFLTFF